MLVTEATTSKTQKAVKISMNESMKTSQVLPGPEEVTDTSETLLCMQMGRGTPGLTD